MSVFNFDERAFRISVEQINPGVMIFPLSTTTGSGTRLWTGWLADRIEKTRAAKPQAGA